MDRELIEGESARGHKRGSLGASIELKRVRKVYGEFAAVDSVSLSISPGEFLTLLGPSGSGKTTILNMIAGFTYPTDGEILIDGRPMGSTPPHKRGIGVVLQNYALFPHMDVVANVEFGLKMRSKGRSEARDMALQALELVGMKAHAHKMPSQLSGGQQQRVALARALVFQPRIILMDEPLSALDRRLRDRLKMEIKELHNRLSSTIVYVTHDQSEALTMSDRVAVLDDGKLLSVTDPISMYNKPAMRFVANFLGESNEITAKVIDAQAGRIAVGDSEATIPLAALDSKDGDTVVLTIRPERVLLRRPRSRDTILAKVRRVTFLGDMYRVDATIEGSGEVVQTRIPNVTSEPPCQVGDEVGVYWDPSQIASIRRREADEGQ